MGGGHVSVPGTLSGSACADRGCRRGLGAVSHISRIPPSFMPCRCPAVSSMGGG